MPIRRFVALLATAVVVGVSAHGGAASFGAASDWPGCSAFTSQPQAQAYWESKARPEQADGDDDGKVCEALPSANSGPSGSGSCTRTSRVVRVGLSKTKYPNVLAHARRAAAAGWPSVYVLNRSGASERREKLLEGIRTKPGFDRDEAPPAVGRGDGKGLQRGRRPTGWRGHVEYVPSGENRGAGAVMGIKLRRFCDGTRFRYVGY